MIVMVRACEPRSARGHLAERWWIRDERVSAKTHSEQSDLRPVGPPPAPTRPSHAGRGMQYLSHWFPPRADRWRERTIKKSTDSDPVQQL